MLQKKIWIPVVLVLIGVAIGGTFWGQHIASQEPIKIYTPVELETTPKPPPPGETAESGHWHGDEWHADDAHGDAPPRGIVSDLNADRQERIDAEIEAAHYEGATDAEILSKLQAAGHPIETDAEIQKALRRQRVRQYLKDREAWNKKFHQAHTLRMQASEAVVSFIPNLSPDRSPEGVAAYLEGLSDAERKQLFAQYQTLIEKSDAARKRLETVKQEEPIYPIKE